MTRVTIPAGYRSNNTRRVLRSILQYDQLDDWIPDPIYYRDVDETAFLNDVSGIIASGAVDCGRSPVLDIYGGSQLKFRAAAAPLLVRVLLADVVASEAEKLQRSLLGDYVFGFKYQKDDSAYNEWSADVFGGGFGLKGTERPPCDAGSRNQESRLPSDWNTRHSAPGPPRVFTAGGEGLHECLTSVGRYMASSPTPRRSVLWIDISGFYRAANRAKLNRTLEQCGSNPQVVSFTSKIFEALSIGPQELVSLDDTVAFLANFYLKPLDDALAQAKIVWRRYGDEYFLLAQGPSSTQSVRNAAKLLTEAAQRQGLKVNLAVAKTLDVNYKELDNLEALADDCTASWSVLDTDGFRLYVLAQASSLTGLESGDGTFRAVVSPGAWEASLKSVLEQPAGAAPLNTTFNLLRTMNVSRKDDVLRAPERGTKLSVRGQRYQETLARQGWLPAALQARLSESVSKNLVWHQLWLLRLAADAGSAAASATAPRVRQLMDSQNSVVSAQAAFTFARIASPTDLALAGAKMRPVGDWLPDRMLACAACLAGIRLGRDLMGSSFEKMEARLISYLRSVAKAQ